MLPHAQSAMTSAHASIARQLEQLIYTKATRKVCVHIQNISGDSSCLFIALSIAVTGSQTQHDLLRMYITTYMAEPEVAEKLESLYSVGDRAADSHIQHVMSMQESGQ